MFDPATLVFTFFTAQCAGTVALTAVWFINRQVPGIGTWVLARVALGSGLLLFQLQPAIPLAVSSLISTTLILFGHVLAIVGTRRFMEKQPIRNRWFAIFIVVYVVLMSYFAVIQPESLLRPILVSAAMMLLSLVHVWSLLPDECSTVRVSSRVMAGIYGFTAAFYVARIGYNLADLAGHPIVDFETDVVLTMLEGTAASVLIASTYITMVTEHLQADLRQQAETDALTGLLNRRAFDRLARRDVQAARRHHDATFLLFLDLDRFKSINDRFGHLAGDRVIRALAETIKASVRETDLSARLGGEEFAVLLPRTSLDSARTVAERIRGSMETQVFDGAGKRFSATLSVGIAALDGGNDDLDSLMHRADQALYRAKEEGRNRIVVSLDPPSGQQVA